MMLALLSGAITLHAQHAAPPLTPQQFAGEYADSGGELSLEYFMPEEITFDPDVPTPQEVLGFNIGEWHLRHGLAVRYLEAIAEASDRVTLHEYGRTYEQRPLILLTITHPDNQANIEDIRENHVALSNPEVSGDLDISEMPAVVWLGYSIHGNEHSGVNAAMLSAYYYAAAQGSEIEEQLSETVILLDPSFNPDGQDRFVTWANSHRNMTRLTTDSDDREFNEPWPRGRTNHYWYDLNRDWMPLQHPESRGRMEMYHHWKPNVLTDHHEMGTNATYFFQPGIPSRNNPMTDERNFELVGKLAEYHAENLDEFGQLYYSKESFDDFYVGKGSTYPDLNGTIGILFEQASSRGHVQESQHGLVPFPETIRNQFQTSLSSVTGSYEMRRELLSYQRSHFQQAMEEAGNDRVKAFVVSAPDDPARMYHLLDILSRHQIEVHELDRSISANGSEFMAGHDYIIPTSQPQYRLVRSLMETRTSFSDSLFYDVSSWSLPHAFNLKHAELTRRPFSRNLLGDVIEAESLMFPTGELIGGQAGMAYIFEWDGYYAPRALYDLQHEGVRAKVANREFILPVGEDGGDRSFNLGSVIVPVGIQDACTPPELHDMVEAAAERNGINVYAVNTGLAEAGADLGSPSMSVLEKPEVLLFVGDGVTVSEAGETWYELDQRYNVPVSMVEMDRFSRVDLPRYNTIIMPNGNYNGLSSRDRERLAGWVSDGGLIIAYKNAVRWLVNNEMASVSFASAEDRETEGGLAYADASQNRGAQFIGGSIFEVTLDNTHPLTYGYHNETLSVFRNSTIFMEAPENPYAAPLRYTENPLVSGYISEENLAVLPGTASVIVGGRGSGRIIMMADNPNFRAFWFGTNKLFANSLFFGRTLSGRSIER
jgi:hypothetical protein